MSIKRVTITVRSDVLRRLDKMVDGSLVKNRSHAIDQLITRGLSKTDLDTVVIMAGGDGARLRPITYEIPKPLIPIRGRPVLEHQINMLKKFDVRNIIVAVGANHDQVREYFGNGSKFGVNLEYVVEKKPLGKMGALGLLRGKVKDTFAVLNVDALVNPDIPEIYNFHKAQKTLGTIMLATVEDPRDYGVVRMKGNNIVEFVDRPERAPTNLVDASFYVFEPDVLKLIPRGKFGTNDLFKILAKEGQLSGFVHDGYLFDVATHEGYEKAIKGWKAG
jgi:NDP-sugar pyrophosphorylase family protein